MKLLIMLLILTSCSTVKIDKCNKIVKRNGLFYLKTTCKQLYIKRDTIL